MSDTRPPAYRLSLVDVLIPEDEWEPFVDPPIWEQIDSEAPFSRIEVGDEFSVTMFGALTPHTAARVVRRFGDGVDAPREEIFVWVENSGMPFT